MWLVMSFCVQTGASLMEVMYASLNLLLHLGIQADGVLGKQDINCGRFLSGHIRMLSPMVGCVQCLY